MFPPFLRMQTGKRQDGWQIIYQAFTQKRQVEFLIIAGTGSQNVPQNPEQHPRLCGYNEFHVPWDGRVPGVGRKARLVVSQEYGEIRSPAVFASAHSWDWSDPSIRAVPRAFTAGGSGGAEPPRGLS